LRAQCRNLRGATPIPMEIRNLEGLSAAYLTRIFNLAFSDYMVPLELTEEQMTDKLMRGNLDLGLSAGAFENGELCAFILSAIDEADGEPMTYNTGTGVIPAYRGRHLTKALYDYLVPELRAKGIRKHLLEVVVGNDRALRAYEGRGFRTSRTVACYKGKTIAEPRYPVEHNRWDLFPFSKAWWDFEPTWQHCTASVLRLKEKLHLLSISLDDQPVAYAVFMKDTGRLYQFAVDPAHRRKGLGSALFAALSELTTAPELRVINVSPEATAAFFGKLGLSHFADLYEMRMEA